MPNQDNALTMNLDTLPPIAGQDSVFADKDRANKFYASVRSLGHSVTSWLTSQIPVSERGAMDGYEYACWKNDIRLYNDRALGVTDTPVINLFEAPQNRATVITSQPFAFQPGIYPETIERNIRMAALQEDELAATIAESTPASGTGFRQITMEESNATTGNLKATRQMTRTSQSTVSRRLRLELAEREDVWKDYSTALEVDYQFMRRSQIGMEAFAKKIQRIAIQNRVDRYNAVLDKLLSTDAVAGGPRNLNLGSDLHAAVNTHMDFTAFANFVLNANYYNGERYQFDTMICNLTVAADIYTMGNGLNINPFQLMGLATLPGQLRAPISVPESTLQTIKLIVWPTMTANTVLCIDSKQAVGEAIEQGSELVETDKVMDIATNVTWIRGSYAPYLIVPNARLTITYGA